MAFLNKRVRVRRTRDGFFFRGVVIEETFSYIVLHDEVDGHIRLLRFDDLQEIEEVE